MPIEDRLDALAARLEKLDRVSCKLAALCMGLRARTPMSDDEETDNAVEAERNFYKVEKWTRDGMRQYLEGFYVSQPIDH